MSLKTRLIKTLIGGAIAAIGMVGVFDENISWLLLIIGFVIVGGDVLIRALQNLFDGNALDENFLMAIATLGAFVINEGSEAIFVMIFYQIGELFQDYAVGKSRGSISELMDIRPEYANVKRNDEILQVSPNEVQIGELIIIKAGEKVPLDGVVVEGTAAVDTKALTGEALPLDVKAGDTLLSGCINQNGRLTIRVTHLYENSTVAKILEMVENASIRKSKTEKFITKFAQIYTPTVVGIGVVLALLPPLLGFGSFVHWFYNALSFLVISCPCALVISIPLGFFGGIGGAARKGILFKGSNTLEALSKSEIVAFDKTGTLTKGDFEVVDLVPTNHFTKEELLELTAMAETHSNHPIAQSIVDTYGKTINNNPINVEEMAGHGLIVSFDDYKLYAGNHKLMEHFNITYSPVKTLGSVVHLAKDQIYVGYIVVGDKIKEDSAHTIKTLKSMGIKETILLTGDRKATAESVGKTLGIDTIYSELLPGDKVDKVEEALNRGKLVFVGDGINDAPVLARADIGIAMGAGAQAAIEASDVVIMNNAPSKIVTAIDISKKTIVIVKQNIIFSLGIKALVLILATLGLSTLWMAIFADVGVAFIAILNAMRALSFKETTIETQK